MSDLTDKQARFVEEYLRRGTMGQARRAERDNRPTSEQGQQEHRALISDPLKTVKEQ